MRIIPPINWIACEEFQLVLIADFLPIMDQRNAFGDEGQSQHGVVGLAEYFAGRPVPGVLIVIFRIKHPIGIQWPGRYLIAQEAA